VLAHSFKSAKDVFGLLSDAEAGSLKMVKDNDIKALENSK
jgi:hypothetical protein